MQDSKPERRFRGLDGFREYVIGWRSGSKRFFEQNPDKFPCLECRGDGLVDDNKYSCGPYDRPDQLPCPTCRGTRCCEKQIFKAAYQKGVQEYRDNLAAWKEQESLRKSGLKKLTKEEKLALGL